jgi:signal transduction histidine kinase
MDFLGKFFSQTGFMPHGHCYLWKPPLIWTHVTSDLFIGLAYLSISFTLYALVRKIRLPFSPVFIAFGVFIGACGMTHFMEVWTLWHPDYWASGGVKVVTAIASVATGLALFPIKPKVVEVANAARLSEGRRIQLESANKELEFLYSKIKEADELKTQFFSNVSHELRTPLALILGPIEGILADKICSDHHRVELEVVRRNAKTLLKQVNDLLDISKLEAGRMNAKYSEADLAKVVRLVAFHFDALARERNIRYTVQGPDSLKAQFDVGKTERIILNLLSNAFKFVPTGGLVQCRLSTVGKNVVIEVHDNGPGVPLGMREMIFERFSQGESGSTRKFGGTGLGLAIVKDFVHLQNGDVTVCDAPTGGALFTVKIPLCAPESVVVSKQDSSGFEPSLESTVEGTLTEISPQPAQPLEQHHSPYQSSVLVVEDNVELNRFIAQTLATDYHVITAMNGQEGLAKAEALLPDAIITDIMMPTMSGDQMSYEVRQRQELQDVPIVLLTAKSDDDLKIKLLKEIVQDYVTKPFLPEELKARVKNLVRLKRAKNILEHELSIKSDNVEELAKEVAKKNRDLAIALDCAKVARQQAERASYVKSCFLGMVSHELRTPLTTLKMNVEMAMKDKNGILTDKQKRMLDRAVSSSSQLTDLIEGLLQYIRLEGGKLVSRNERIDLSIIARDAVLDHQVIAEQKGIMLQANIPETTPPIESDPELVRILFNNLIENAVKFTDHGSVMISVSHNEMKNVISVKDTGPGIAKEDQLRIFDPFEQIEPLERKSIPGVGLGLALVKEIVEALHCELEIDSQLGMGTTFTVKIPSDLGSIRGQEAMRS